MKSDIRQKKLKQQKKILATKIAKGDKDKKKRAEGLKTVPKKKWHPITDHAVLRYLERYYQLDADAVREEMWSDDVDYAIKSGAISVPIGDMVFKIADKRITTVYNKA